MNEMNRSITLHSPLSNEWKVQDAGRRARNASVSNAGIEKSELVYEEFA